MNAHEAIQLVVEKKAPKGWSSAVGIFGNFSRWPHEVEWYVKCPKCGKVHGSFKSMREAHAKRLCSVCNLEEIEALKKQIAQVNDPDHKVKPMSEIVKESAELDPERFLGAVKPYRGDPDEEIKLGSFIEANATGGDQNGHTGEPEWFMVIEQPNGWYIDTHLTNGNVRLHSGPFGAEQLQRFRTKWPVLWHNWPKHITEAIDPTEFDPFDEPPERAPEGVPVPPEDEPFDTKSEIDRLLLGNWVDIALRELSEELNEPLADMEIEGYEGDYDKDAPDETTHFTVKAGHTYHVFKDEDTAKDYARTLVRNDLENEPGLFTQSWLQQFVDEERLKDAIGDPNENWEEEEVGNLDYEELLQKMVDEGYVDYDDAVFFKKNGEPRVENPGRARALDQIKDKYVEEKKPEPPDPWEYLEDIYGKEEAAKQAIEMAGIDVDRAAESALDTDGWQHFVASYDGESHDLPGGAVYVRRD